MLVSLMKKTTCNKTVNFAGLLLLAVFVNLYLVQLVCNLPHLVERLQPTIQSQHHAGHSDHHHGTESGTSTSGHHHGEEQHDSSPEDGGCCSEFAYAPLFKSSPSVELSSLVKEQLNFMGSLYQAVLWFLHKVLILAVSQAPPDVPPKIPDIRIFLCSLTI